MDITIARNEIVLVTQVRDEALRLPFFLHYYRRLGVSKFFVVDNGSTDDTRAVLDAAPDVHTFSNEARYEGSWAAIKPVLQTFCTNRWCIHVDADEFLVLPRELGVTMSSAIQNLELERATALHCVMVEMYSDRSIFKTPLVSGEDLFARCPFFDPFSPGPDGKLVPSSPRMRLFGLYNNLEKYPLFFYDPKVETTGPGARAVHQLANVIPSRVHAVIAHFKLLNDLYSKTERAIQEKTYWNESAEYVHMAKRLREDLVPFFYGSLTYRGPDSFCAAGYSGIKN